MSGSRQLFESMFAASDDPWGFRTRWYEARKRSLTLACLPEPFYQSGYEPGCANGELAAALATRCARLRVSDGIETAVQLSKARLAGFAHVDVAREWLPDEWPNEVLSEFCFYLNEATIASIAARAAACLTSNGTLLACHWRHPVDGFALHGDEVHAILSDQLRLPRLVHHEERDFVLDVWSLNAESVAQREGFV